MSIRKKTFIPAVLAIFVLTFSWQVFSWEMANPAIFPGLDDILIQTGLLLSQNNFYISLLTTFYRILIGLTIAILLATGSGSLSAFVPFWNSFFQPIVAILRSIPIISVILIALIWFNPPALPIFIATLTMYPILHNSISSALRQVDVRLVEMAQVFGFYGIQTFFKIHIPASRELLISGISTALGFGWRAVIIGEVLSQPLHGIGTGMKSAQVYLNMSALFAWTVLAITASYAVELFIKHSLKDVNFKHLSIKPGSKNKSLKIESHIEIKHLFKAYLDKNIIENVNQNITNTKIQLLTSASGSGKTTFLKLIAGIIKPDKGNINFHNINTIAFAFQDKRLCNWLTVNENIRFSLSKKNNLQPSDIGSFDSVIQALEISDILQKFPHELSGGEQQRVSLARALVSQAELLLLDEPLSGLDQVLKQRIIQFLGKYIATYQPIVIWATHENIQLENLDFLQITSK